MGGDFGGWLPENRRARVFPENPGPPQALEWQGIAPTWFYGSSGMAGYEWLLKFNTPPDDKCIFPKTGSIRDRFICVQNDSNERFHVVFYEFRSAQSCLAVIRIFFDH
jgi:hypothetical protein